MSNDFEQTFTYADLRDVDPNFTAVPEDVYTLRVLKFEESKTGKGKPFVKASFSIVNSGTVDGRRLWHNFWEIGEGGRDLKPLRRIMDATGVQQTEGGEAGFKAWLEELTNVQPEFKVLVTKRPPTQYNKEMKATEPKLGPDGAPLPDENFISFKNVSPAN